ncbi:MAG TPA: hypothetical protein VM488_07555 [Pseudobacter sp.]|nr:hypothetical protein [Pseudobacter sp.]
MKRVLIMSSLFFSSFAVMAQEKEAPAPATIREGAHKFSLQWIGWGEQFGSAQIKKLNDSTYSVKGEQRSEDKEDFVSIDGNLVMITPRRLRFEGTILTKVKHNNNNEVCNKTGTYTFFASGVRKYWRLQEMDNCDKGNAVDYVDIFF